MAVAVVPEEQIMLELELEVEDILQLELVAEAPEEQVLHVVQELEDILVELQKV